MTQKLSPFQELLHVVHDTCDVARCRQILDSGIDVNATTSKGCTPLMFAVMPNEFGEQNVPQATLEMVRVLLACGADPTIVDSFGMTAADYARQLLDPNWKDLFGETAAGRWNDPGAESTVAEMIALLDPSRRER